eukprot:scaffold781_cov123-Isochrysis_galbana.AAC.8
MRQARADGSEHTCRGHGSARGLAGGRHEDRDGVLQLYQRWRGVRLQQQPPQPTHCLLHLLSRQPCTPVRCARGEDAEHVEQVATKIGRCLIRRTPDLLRHRLHAGRGLPGQGLGLGAVQQQSCGKGIRRRHATSGAVLKPGAADEGGERARSAGRRLGIRVEAGHLQQPRQQRWRGGWLACAGKRGLHPTAEEERGHLRVGGRAPGQPAQERSAAFLQLQHAHSWHAGHLREEARGAQAGRLVRVHVSRRGATLRLVSRSRGHGCGQGGLMRSLLLGQPLLPRPQIRRRRIRLGHVRLPLLVGLEQLLEVDAAPGRGCRRGLAAFGRRRQDGRVK